MLFKFIKNSGNKDDLKKLIYENENKKIEVKTLRLINRITKAGLEIAESEGEINMCKAIEDMRKEAIQEGEIKNLNDNIKTMKSNGFDANTIAKALSLDIEYVKKVLAS